MTHTPFGTLGPILQANGFNPVAILPGTKAPDYPHWSTPRDITSMAANGKADHYTGILTANHPTIDGDCYDPDISKAARRIVQDIIGDTLMRVGQAPKFAAICKTDTPYKKIKSAQWIDPLKADDTLTNQIEVLGDGQQVVIDGIHAGTGKPYKTNRRIEQVKTTDLPTLDQDTAVAIITAFDQHCESLNMIKVGESDARQKLDKHPTGPIDDLDTIKPPIEITVRELKQLLRELDPSTMHYDQWLETGMALHHQFNGSPKGLKYWLTWSQDGGKNTKFVKGQYTPDDYQAKWDTFKAIGERRPLTLATLLKWQAAGDYCYQRKTAEKASKAAKQAVSEPSHADTTPAIDIQTLFSHMRLTDEMLKNIKEAEYAYPGMIITGQLTIICGLANSGKSALMRHVCSHFVHEERMRVVYFDLDSPAAMIARNEYHAREHGYVYAAPQMVIGGSAQMVLDALEKALETGADLHGHAFVLDTLKKFADLMSKNKVKLFLEMLRELTARGATVICLGHANKYRDKEGNIVFEGTGDVKNDADNLTYIEFQKDTESMTQVISTYPDKTRGIIEPLSFKLDLDTFEVEELTEYIDVKVEVAATQKVTSNMNKADPDKTIRATVRDAIKDGFSVQSEIVAYCRDRGHPKHKIARTLKFSSDPDSGGIQWLIKEQIPGKDNRIVYHLLEDE